MAKKEIEKMKATKLIAVLVFAGAGMQLSAMQQDQPSMQARLKNAAIDGNIEEVRNLLRQGVEVAGSFALSAAVVVGHEDICKLLIENGADVNESNRSMGFTKPLFYAISLKYDSVSELLIENNAVLDLIHPAGFTALTAAVFYGREAVVRLLLTRIPLVERQKILVKRAEIRARIDTASMAMRRTGSVAQSDIRRMIGRMIYDQEIESIVVEQLDRIKKMLTATDEEGRTAQDLALDRGLPELAELLDQNNLETIAWLRVELEKNIREILFTRPAAFGAALREAWELSRRERLKAEMNEGECENGN